METSWSYKISKPHKWEQAVKDDLISNEVIKTVASDLGNTPAVCKSSYIHPVLLSDWQDGKFRSKWSKASRGRKMKGLSKEETATLQYLKI